MKVLYLGLARHAAGCEEEEVSVPDGSLVRDLIEILGRRHGQKFARSLTNGRGGLHVGVRILLGGEDLPPEKALDIRLSNSSEVTLLILARPMAGG